MVPQNTIDSRRLRHGMRAGLILATSVLGFGSATAWPTEARTSMEANQTVQRIELDAERVHAGSTAADVERPLGQPTSTIALGVPRNGARVARLLGPAESTVHSVLKGQPIEYSTYRQSEGEGVVTTTCVGGVLAAFTIWPTNRS